MHLNKYFIVSLLVISCLLLGCFLNSQGKRALRGIFYSGSEGTEILFIDENYGVL